MKPLIFVKKEVHVNIFNYRFEKIGELKKNLLHKKYDLHLCKGKYLSDQHLKEVVTYHDKNLIQGLK